jgi:hypothetical protein
MTEAAGRIVRPVLTSRAATRTIAPIDTLPKWLLCVPLVAQWFWLSFRYGSATLPSNVNPRIETGGLVGESKALYFAQIEKLFGDWLLPVHPVASGHDAEAVRTKAGLSFPLIAKPDIGWCGYGVRRINDANELRDYAKNFPAEATFLLQALALEPFEAGLQYIRWPGQERGRITALTIRQLPQVTGDGVHDVATLIATDQRANRKSALYGEILPTATLKYIPATGERVQLTTVASARVGSLYEDGAQHVTEDLQRIIDEIARTMGEFHFGRFDVRFSSLEALRAGRFKIIEVNGAGSEAIQFWDPKLSLFEAYAGVFAKQRTLFALAAEMRRRGVQPCGARALISAHLRQQRLIPRYPKSN